MKKTLLLAAMLAGFAGAASAQSSLTLYGIIDIGYAYEKNSTNGNNDRTSKTAQMSGHQSGSRFGLKGVEDLGNGLKANFVLESGFTADDGKSGQGGRLFGRKAYAGIETSFGEVRLGRQTSVTSDTFSPVDPFGAGFDRAAAGKVFLSADTVRFDNAISYLSPDFSGFKFGVNYSTQIDGPEVQTGYNNRWISMAGSYTWDKLYVMASYDRHFVGNNQTTGDDYENRDMWSIGATYDFTFLKLHGAYGQMDGCNGNSSGNYLCSSTGNIVKGQPKDKDHTSDVVLIGVSAPITTNSKVFASYKTALDWDVNSYSVGYTYNLSKRTNLYASYNYTENLTSRREVTGNAGDKDRDYDQFAVGVRHTF